MLVAGIDPGREGFITVLDSLSCRGWILKLRYCKKKILQYEDIELLPKIDICFVEQVHGRGGWAAKANFGLGSYYGQIKMALNLYGFECQDVLPKTWVNHFSDTKGATKQRTLEAYKKNFKHAPIKPRIVMGEEKYNNNLIDSLMIALYGYNQIGLKTRKWEFHYVN